MTKSPEDLHHHKVMFQYHSSNNTSLSIANLLTSLHEPLKKGALFANKTLAFNNIAPKHQHQTVATNRLLTVGFNDFFVVCNKIATLIETSNNTSTIGMNMISSLLLDLCDSLSNIEHVLNPTLLSQVFAASLNELPILSMPPEKLEFIVTLFQEFSLTLQRFIAENKTTNNNSMLPLIVSMQENIIAIEHYLDHKPLQQQTKHL